MNLRQLAWLFVCLHSAFAAISDREEWDKRFYNFTGPFLVDPGNGGAPGPIALYRAGEFLIAGKFTNLADIALTNFARWDGTTWQKPFADVSSGAANAGDIHIAFTSEIDRVNGIHSIATREGTSEGQIEVLIGGAGITNAGGVAVANIAWWTGLEWDNLAGGTTGRVSTVLFENSGAKIVGGNFTSIGGISATNIARYVGLTWEPLADGLPFIPDALLIYNDQLHAAGSTQDGTEASLLRWSGTEWVQDGSALNVMGGPRISALLASPDGLYVAGSFTNIGGLAANNIALWTGAEWRALGDGLPPRVNSLAEYQGDILAVGYFLTAAQRGIARWNGTNWSFDSSTPLVIGKTIAASGDKILARGQVDLGLDVVFNGAAYLDGDGWMPLGQGVPPAVMVIENNAPMHRFVSDERGVSLAISHGFNATGVIERWSGHVWEPVGDLLRFPTRIHAVDLQGDHYWVGTTSPGWLIPNASTIAATGETNWTGAAGGFQVADLVVAGEKVFAGGASGLYEWNGTQFSKVTSYSRTVRSLATDGNNLYVAGRLSPMSGPYSISRYDGVSWTEIGSIPSVTQRFEVQFVNGALYVFGGFSSISGNPFNRIARWDGQQWHAVIPGTVNMNIFALAGDGRESLFVGGVGVGSPARLYQIRGAEIIPVAASGISPAATVEALHWWRGALYVAGTFTTIQTVPAQGVAAWHDSEAAVEVILSAPTNAVAGAEAEIVLHVANVQSGPITNVALTMPIPPGVTPLNLTPGMSVEGTNLIWQFASLESGLTNLNARFRIQGSTGTNLTFEVTAAGSGIPTFRSSPAWTTISAPAEFYLNIVGLNSDGSTRLGLSGSAPANWIVEKSQNLIDWDGQTIERREGQAANEFTIPASLETHTFWRIRAVAGQ
jgi:hypothetical protein